MKRILAILTVLSSCLVGARAQETYFTIDDMPDLVKCLPAPPDTVSLTFSHDVMRYLWGKTMRADAARAAVAARDAIWDLDTLAAIFSEPFGLKIDKETTPEIYKAFVQGVKTIELIRIRPKAYFMRKRPFDRFQEHMYTTWEEDELRGEGSYPSGHSIRGWSAALLLAEINPANAGQLYARGWDYGESRVIVGAHWQSDVDASRAGASIGYSLLQTSPAYREQMEKARQEYARILPAAPDYTDQTMWITQDGDPKGTGADIFYVVSTWEKDWTDAEGHLIHYADVWNPVHRERMGREINGVAAYMAPGNRFYAPFYRHATINAFLTRDDETIRERTRLSMKDVCDAFDLFVKRRDPRRPLIIAGFSQGGMAVVELLKHMDDATYSQLAAAYVLGYKVTEEDLAACPHIRAAVGPDDTGVTICYNTVKDVKYVNPVIATSSIGINPVNWTTDATPAVLRDSITVTLSPEYHVLVVDGYEGKEYPPYADFINVGDIHSCEPWLYSECLQENMAVRAQAWRQGR